MKVLIVDETSFSRKEIAALLDKAGYLSVAPSTTAEALYYLKGNANKISLIIINATLEQDKAIEPVKILRAGPATRIIPILAVVDDNEETIHNLLGAGVSDIISTPLSLGRITARLRAALMLRKTTEALEDQKIEADKLQTKLIEVSTTDGLTGLISRSHFEGLYEREWYRARREKDFLSLLMIDIDYFRLYNEEYGHLGGDDRIRELAGIIRKTINRPCDLAARFSGEVFAVLLPGTDLNGAASVADKIRTRIEGTKIEHSKSPSCCNLTVSIGVSTTIPSRKALPDGLIYAADKALLTGKNQGRNQVQVATDI